MLRKNLLKLITWSLVLLGFFMLFAPKDWFPDFYYPLYFGIIALLSPLLISLPLLFLDGKTPRKSGAILDFQLIIAFSLAINIAGQLGLYQLYKFGFEYDKFAHFLVCMLFAFIFGEVLKEWTLLPPKGIVLLVIFLLLCSGIVWEIFEAVSDLFFGTQEWGVYGQYVIPDTFKDLGFNMLGSLAGVLIFLIPKR